MNQKNGGKNKMAVKKSFIVPIAYDADMLPNSISKYYDYADEIILGLDEDRITWSGNRFTFDEGKLHETLKKLDRDNKIQIIEENFHKSKIPIENDNFTRNFLKSQCTNDWIMSIDSDEEMINAKEFFYDFCPLVERYHDSRDFLLCWMFPWKEFENSYLVIGSDDLTPHRETQGFATSRHNTYTYARWTNNKQLLMSPLAVIHWSLCRTREALHQKINNIGHSNLAKTDPFFQIWEQTNLENYGQYRNFKTSGLGNVQWPCLLEIKKTEFKDYMLQGARLQY